VRTNKVKYIKKYGDKCETKLTASNDAVFCGRPFLRFAILTATAARWLVVKFRTAQASNLPSHEHRLNGKACADGNR
jgi:hypothetical protein